MSKVSREVAEKEVEQWLDHKKISPKKRETQKEYVEVLIDAVSEGVLTLQSETHIFVHTLKFPPEGAEDPIKTLEYKPRLQYANVKGHLRGVASGDGDARFIAYMAALTSKPKLVFEKLDSEDMSVAQAITLFFV